MMTQVYLHNVPPTFGNLLEASIIDMAFCLLAKLSMSW